MILTAIETRTAALTRESTEKSLRSDPADVQWEFLVPHLWVELIGERTKPINIKNFGGTPPGVRPVCPGDTSHLSRDMSRLSWGQFCPFSIDLHINQAQMSQVSLGRPEFVPGMPPGHPAAKFLYVIFLYRFFSLLTSGSEFWEVGP